MKQEDPARSKLDRDHFADDQKGTEFVTILSKLELGSIFLIPILFVLLKSTFSLYVLRPYLTNRVSAIIYDGVTLLLFVVFFYWFFRPHVTMSLKGDVLKLHHRFHRWEAIKELDLNNAFNRYLFKTPFNLTWLVHLLFLAAIFFGFFAWIPELHYSFSLIDKVPGFFNKLLLLIFPDCMYFLLAAIWIVTTKAKNPSSLIRLHFRGGYVVVPVDSQLYAYLFDYYDGQFSSLVDRDVDLKKVPLPVVIATIVALSFIIIVPFTLMILKPDVPLQYMTNLLQGSIILMIGVMFVWIIIEFAKEMRKEKKQEAGEQETAALTEPRVKVVDHIGSLNINLSPKYAIPAVGVAVFFALVALGTAIISTPSFDFFTIGRQGNIYALIGTKLFVSDVRGDILLQKDLGEDIGDFNCSDL